MSLCWWFWKENGIKSSVSKEIIEDYQNGNFGDDILELTKIQLYSQFRKQEDALSNTVPNLYAEIAGLKLLTFEEKMESVRNITKEDIVKGNIELFGNKQIIVDGCKGVIDYNEDFLKLDLGKIILKVTGKNLVIDSYIYEQVDLKGEIVSVEFMN